MTFSWHRKRAPQTPSSLLRRYRKPYEPPVLCYLKPYGAEGWSSVRWNGGGYMSYSLESDRDTRGGAQGWLDCLPCRRGCTHPNAWRGPVAPWVTYKHGRACPCCGMAGALDPPGGACDRCGWPEDGRCDVPLAERRKLPARWIDEIRWEREAQEGHPDNPEPERLYFPEGTLLSAEATFRVENGRPVYAGYDPFTLTATKRGPVVSIDQRGVFLYSDSRKDTYDPDTGS